MSTLFIFRLSGLSAAPQDLGSHDVEDDAVTFPAETMTAEEMEHHCQQQLTGLPPLLTRQFMEYAPPTEQCDTDPIRIMQWNMLSQGKIYFCMPDS